jgi:hypothetical protein
MYTLLLPGRSHAISDETAARLLRALCEGKRVEVVPIELNGEGSGAWDVALNVRQVIALSNTRTRARTSKSRCNCESLRHRRPPLLRRPFRSARLGSGRLRLYGVAIEAGVCGVGSAKVSALRFVPTGAVCSVQSAS